MLQLEDFGINQVSERQIYFLELPGLSDLSASLHLSSRYFTLLLACDARHISNDVIAQAAGSLIKQGLVYVCAWGADCARVEDIFDEVIVEINPDETEKSVIMTTQHDDESLDEALWYLLYVAFAADDYEEDCRAEVIAVVDNKEWATHIRTRLADQNALSQDVTSEGMND